MGRYIARRLLLAIPVLLVTSILIFGGVRVIPGNVCGLVLGSAEGMTEETCARVDRDLGLDQPVVKQYFTWLGNVLQGDLGTSMINRRPVATEIVNRLYTTLELSILAGAFAVALALPIGVYSALKQYKRANVALHGVTKVWLSRPSFRASSMLITLPAK